MNLVSIFLDNLVNIIRNSVISERLIKGIKNSKTKLIPCIPRQTAGARINDFLVVRKGTYKGTMCVAHHNIVKLLECKVMKICIRINIAARWIPGASMNAQESDVADY